MTDTALKCGRAALRDARGRNWDEDPIFVQRHRTGKSHSAPMTAYIAGPDLSAGFGIQCIDEALAVAEDDGIGAILAQCTIAKR